MAKPSPSSIPPHQAVTPKKLISMSESELDALYRVSPIGPIPNGATNGTPILFPGSFVTGPMSTIAKALFWSGKVFNAQDGSLLNSLLPFGKIYAVQADVYEGDSWLVPSEKAIIIDYSKRIWPFCTLRDEVRNVGPGIYMGPAYVGKVKAAYFFLETDEERKDQ